MAQLFFSIAVRGKNNDKKSSNRKHLTTFKYFTFREGSRIENPSWSALIKYEGWMAYTQSFTDQLT